MIDPYRKPWEFCPQDRRHVRAQYVLQIVWPAIKLFIQEKDHRRVHEAVFKALGTFYGAVWHDIWDNLSVDNLPQMTALKRKYGRRARWQGCWSEPQVRARIKIVRKLAKNALQFASESL
jgi:hypothetical protein